MNADRLITWTEGYPDNHGAVSCSVVVTATNPSFPVMHPAARGFYLFIYSFICLFIYLFNV